MKDSTFDTANEISFLHGPHTTRIVVKHNLKSTVPMYETDAQLRWTNHVFNCNLKTTRGTDEVEEQPGNVTPRKAINYCDYTAMTTVGKRKGIKTIKNLVSPLQTIPRSRSTCPSRWWEIKFLSILSSPQRSIRKYCKTLKQTNVDETTREI